MRPATNTGTMRRIDDVWSESAIGIDVRSIAADILHCIATPLCWPSQHRAHERFPHHVKLENENDRQHEGRMALAIIEAAEWMDVSRGWLRRRYTAQTGVSCRSSARERYPSIS